MMSSNQSDYYTPYRQRHIAEYSAARTYLENNHEEINALQRNFELPKLQNENEYLGETLLDDILPLSIGTLSEEYINCGVILFILDHYISNHNFCYHGTVELANVN